MSFHTMPESPLHSFVRRHNHSSAYQAAFKHFAKVDANREEVQRQLYDELNYIEIQNELKSLQISIDHEQHSLANRRVTLKDRESELLDAQRLLQQQQATLQLELAAFEQEKVRATEEQARLDSATDSLHTKQRQLNEDVASREEAKAKSFSSAAEYVRSAPSQSPFNALTNALSQGAPLSVLRAIVENHCGGHNTKNEAYNYWTPLHYAAWHGHDALCQLLVAGGSEPNERDTFAQYTPLDWALSRGKEAAAEYLASVGAKRGVALEKADHFVVSEKF